MKYIWGIITLKLFGPKIRDHVVWFCINYWWVILLLLILAGIGWIIEWKEKQHKKVINKK
jgi:lipopolysaccharide export system protein LptC